jgi:hypothetical protein
VTYLRPSGFDDAPFPRLDTSPELLELYVRAHDAGTTTYLTWQWHDDPVGKTIADHAYVLDESTWAPAGELLDSALIAGDDDAVKRALTEGPFSSPKAEREMSEVLARVALPLEFWKQLDRASSRDWTVRIRLTPSQRLAPVPWELLISPVSGKRLLAMASIVYEVPYTVHWSRAILPKSSEDPNAQPLFTIDVSHGAAKVAGNVLTSLGRKYLGQRLGFDPNRQPRMTRADLSTQLKSHPSRWLYVGHVSSGGEVGLASIHLTDIALGDPGVPGEEGKPWFGFARVEPDPEANHKPLTARDLHLGTRSALAAEAEHTHRLPARLDTDGAAIWPMPRRVALVACASGAEHASSEVFGLATAALASGAEWVVATRWVLPTDHGFHTLAGFPGESLPLADLVVAVDDAQASPDPVETIRQWQLAQLAQWETGGRLEDSPILWGAVMTYWMPARPDLRDPQLPKEAVKA